MFSVVADEEGLGDGRGWMGWRDGRDGGMEGLEGWREWAVEGMKEGVAGLTCGISVFRR